MFLSIAKWYISRAIDCNRSLPAWVERRLVYDPSLKQFYDQSLRLASRLQTTAAAREFKFSRDRKVDLGTQFREGKLNSKNTRALFATLAVGLAAASLFAFSPFFDQSSMRTETDPTGYVESNTALESPATSVEPNQLDPKQIGDLVASGASFLQRLKQDSDSTDAAVLESDFRQLVALTNLEIDQVIKPVNDLGSSYGSLLSKLDQHAETENRRLLSDGISAWHFFVHKLPQSAASLAGL